MKTIWSLQVFRGIAAMAVVAHHAVLSTDAFVGVGPKRLVAILGGGYLGVDFFFVLSGFIIMHIHMGEDRSRANVRRYVAKRLSRIFPPYLPLSIAIILLYAALPGLSKSGGREYSLVSSLLLIPADQPPALSVAWTLVHEMQFYAAFLLFFLSGRSFLWFCVMWCVVIVGANLVHTPQGWAKYPLSPMNIEFMLGVLAAWIVSGSGLRLTPFLWLAGGTALSVAALTVMTPANIAIVRLAFALGLALVVVGFAVLESERTLLWPALLLLLGNASYSLYLVHNPLLSVTQRLAGRLELPWLAALAFGIVVSTCAGLAYYAVIERPVLQRLRIRFSPSRRHEGQAVPA